MITIPPYLRQGDTVGLICPAGYMPLERTERCVEQLTAWGYQVRIGATVGHQHHYFSGTDQERLGDLQQMLDDPNIKAILCARGGYGTSRIIDQINWEVFIKNPKWIIGYSDVTVLHCHLYQVLQTASLHAPMAGAFAEANVVDEYILTLKDALTGKPFQYTVPPNPNNRTGNGTAPLIGGNLSLLAHLVGTPSMPDTTGCILFIEDVGEYLYNIDRMLLQLNRAGLLANLAGLVVGGFTQLKDTTIGMGSTINEIISSHVSYYNYPVVFDFPISHDTNNIAVKAGVVHTLEVGESGAMLEELPTDKS